MINPCAAFVILNGTQWSEGSGLRARQASHSQARSFAFGSEPALSTAEAEARTMLRVIDEDKSEPDGYLYPASMFAPIDLPKEVEQALMAAGD